MSHPNQMAFVAGIRDRFPDYFVGKNVLEIGSLDINGSVRQFFTGCDYTGVDLGDGPGVDIVCKGHEVPFADRSFDTVISCECLEHDRYWIDTFRKMCDLSSDLVVMTCATTGRAEHGTTATNPADAPFTNDYYENLKVRHFVNNFELDRIFKDYGFEINSQSHDLYFWGKK